MNPLRAAISAMAVFMVSGCFLKMESVSPLPKYMPPLGAHYVKSGMTREERFQDFASCSAASGQGVFPGQPLQQYIIDPEDARRKDPSLLSINRIFRSCMISKGYHQLPLGTCDGNDPKVMEPCMYP
jgi:hypothetical protein